MPRPPLDTPSAMAATTPRPSSPGAGRSAAAQSSLTGRGPLAVAWPISTSKLMSSHARAGAAGTGFWHRPCYFFSRNDATRGAHHEEDEVGDGGQRHGR